MAYIERFSDSDLERIVEEATIYMCACPAQVAVAVRQFRNLRRYQLACLIETYTQSDVHQAIAESAVRAHAELEACLDRVLDMEGWDRVTLRMPEGLRQRRNALVEGATDESA